MLSNACGGFQNLWSVLKGAGENAIHSYGEFHAAFAKRFPECTKKVDNATPQAGPDDKGNASAAAQPAAGAIGLAAQMAALRRSIDAVDARASTRQLKQKSSVAALAAKTPALAPVLTRVHGKRVAQYQRFEASARGAFRTNALAVKPISEQTLKDGSWEKSLDAARSSFIGAVATPLLADLATLKKDLATERASATDPRLTRHLDKLTAKYTRIEKDVQAALASRGTVGKIPDVLIPRSFHGGTTSAPAIP
jgi:hypothetical protein